MLKHEGSGSPLEGMTVVEMATGLAANFASVLLADFGARVIKLEQVDAGDPMRGYGPKAGVDSVYFQTESRGKQSIALDLSHPRGLELARQLIEGADALVEDYGAQGLEKLGLDVAAMMENSPKLSVLRLSGFGQSGPLSGFPGDDRTAQAFSGALYVTGYPDQGPEAMGVPLAEYWSGLMGANGLLMALHATDDGHPGQVVDMAFYEPLLRFQEEMVIQYNLFGTVRERMGNEYAEIVPSNHFETADGGWVAISAANDRAFQRICDAMGQPEAGSDPRFATPSARCENREAVNELIQTWVSKHTVQQVMEEMDRHSAPAGAINSIAEVVRDPHIVHRQNIVPVPSSDGGILRMQGVVPKLSDFPAAPGGGAPRVGENTRDVLVELLDVPETALAELSRDGVIGNG